MTLTFFFFFRPPSQSGSKQKILKGEEKEQKKKKQKTNEMRSPLADECIAEKIGRVLNGLCKNTVLVLAVRR